MSRPGPMPATLAAVELARKYPALPVTEICKISGVGRNAFYKAIKGRKQP